MPPLRKFFKPLRLKNKNPNLSPTTTVQSAPAGEQAQGNGEVKKRLARHGLQVEAEGVEPIIDIVAIHGLNGHPETTWTASNGAHWIRTFLSADLPNARILTWGYDADMHNKDRVSSLTLSDHARNLITNLYEKRETTKTSERPIIFIAHSLGGIIVKSALIQSSFSKERHNRTIKLSTYGIIFMGTPHLGVSSAEIGENLVKVASVFIPANSKLLEHLRRDSEFLREQLLQYGPISTDFETVYFYEAYATKVGGVSRLIVPQQSAVVPGVREPVQIPIHEDHRNMVKFKSQDDKGYETISSRLKIMSENACQRIAANWDAENRIRAAQICNENESFAIRFGVHEIPEARCFVGRKKDLVRMRELLQAEGRLILTGLGGIGKTTLAAAYASKYKDTYSAVFWLNAKDTDSLKQSFLSAAKRIARDHPAFQIDSKSIMEIDNLDKVVDAVKSWLDKPGNTKWLLIYDSHDTPKLPDSNNPEAFDIKSFLPDINKGAIIITTTVSRIEIGHHLSVDKLTKVKHSLAILSHASGRQNLATDPDAEALALEFDGLPLALATAGAYLHEVTISCAQYLLMYRKFYVRLQQLTPNLPSRPDRKLYSTWDLSFAHFRTQKPDSANLLRLWAYFDNQDIWFELLEECKGYGPEWFSKLTEDELSFHDAARVLCNYGLIKADLSPEREDTESKGYSMHNCVHSWTIHVLNQEWDFSLSKIALYRVALHCARARKETNFSLQRRLLQHANRCTDLVLNGWGPRDDHEFTIFIIVILGEMYMDHENLHDAERSFYWAMEMYKTLHGEDDERTLQAMQSLSNVCKRLGKLDEASSLLWDILRVKSKKFPAKHESTMHESTIETRGHFASVLMAQGKLIETEITCYIALVYGKPVINSDLELYLLTILGCLREKQGRLDEAEDLLQRVLDELLKKYGDEDFSTLGAMHNLANVYVREGRFADAEKKYKRILRAREKTQGMKHNDTLDAVNKLGVFYLQWKKLDEAEAKLLQALKVREEVMGAKHLSTLKTVSDLGEVYAKQRKFPKAEEHYQRALDGYESVLEPDHVRTYVPALETRESLGCLYDEQDNFCGAQTMYLKALVGMEAVFGPCHDSCKRIAARIIASNDKLSNNGWVQTKEIRGVDTVVIKARVATAGQGKPDEVECIPVDNESAAMEEIMGRFAVFVRVMHACGKEPELEYVEVGESTSVRYGRISLKSLVG